MKNINSIFLGIFLWAVSIQFSYASLEIYCPKDKEITYQAYLNGYYWDIPIVNGPHTIYGPWVKPNLNCGSGYVDIKWEIVDHYARSYYCTQTIWVNNPYGNNGGVSVWCPKEQTVYCDDIDWIKYPKPEVSGYNYTIYGPYISKSLNECGVGSIWVEWKIVDGCGKITYCKSVVWVKSKYGDPYIWWPKDFEADPCKDNVDPKYLSWPYGYPDITKGNSCAKYGIAYKDQEFYFPNDPGICKKIVRTWSIIDWCIYNPNGYGYGSGKWEHVQLIKLINKTKPTISCTAEIKVNQESYGKFAWVDIPVPQITSSCNGGATITHNSIYATKPSPDASGNYPIGTTEVVFKVKDACGNFSTCTTKVIVLDKTPPTPYCIGSLATTIAWHPDGIYTIIDPKKFDLGSYDNSTPSDKLKFEAVPNKFNCDSIGIRKVRIYVIDEVGNKNYCTVKLNLQDNMGMCPKKPEPPVISKDTLVIAGLISNTQNKSIDSVSMTLTDSTGKRSVMSSGPYKFTELNHGMTYKVEPSKYKKFLEGVTTEDYTLLVDIVQGKDTFTSPYQLIASDIDRNDTIDMDDVFLLGYYLLTKGESIPKDQLSWRFLPKDYDMTLIDLKSMVLDTLPGQLVFEKLNAVYLNANFLGIKIGDINLSLSDPLPTVSVFGGALEQRDRPVSPNGNLIKVFPNPFSENSTLLFNSDLKEKFNFALYDLSGRIIANQKVDAILGMNRLVLESRVFNYEGVYFFKLEGSQNRYSGKLYRFR